MMIGTCGHEVAPEDLEVRCPMVDYDREGNKGVSYGVYCPACRKYFAKEIKKGRKLEKELGFDKGVMHCDA